MITPTYSTVSEAYECLCALYQITVSELEDEYLWPQSMPCIINEEKDIPIAIYNHSEDGMISMNYRKSLLERYGAKKQLIRVLQCNVGDGNRR